MIWKNGDSKGGFSCSEEEVYFLHGENKTDFAKMQEDMLKQELASYPDRGGWNK